MSKFISQSLRSVAHDDISQSLGEEYVCEMATIVWSVAAAFHLEIPLTEIFREKAYKGESQWLLEQYTSQNYLGLPLLQWMRMAAFDAEVESKEKLPFPHLLRWTRA